MAETALTPQNVVPSGLEATYAAAAAGGNNFLNPSDERTFLHVKNGDASDHTVTITKQRSSVIVKGVGALAIADLAIVVTAGEERLIGPFSQAYTDSEGKVHASYDDVTSVTVAALYLASAD